QACQVVAFAVQENVQETYSIPLDPFSNLGRLLQNNEGASSAWGCLVVVVSPHKIHIPVSAPATWESTGTGPNDAEEFPDHRPTTPQNEHTHCKNNPKGHEKDRIQKIHHKFDR
ncbi:unnamed protein product, partial [Ectocarpus sp. 8 AP-2014]